MKIVTVWDGENFAEMDEEKALKLEQQDKAQILRDGIIDGLSLKYRHEFTGYQNRMMSTDASPKGQAEARAAVAEIADKQEPAPDLIEQPDAADEPEQETDSVELDWREHRKAAADHLDKPFNKTTKADVEAYLAEKDA